MILDDSAVAVENSLRDFQPAAEPSESVRLAMQFVENVSNLETSLANAHEQIRILSQQLSDCETGRAEDRAKFQSIYQRLKGECDNLLWQRDHFQRGYYGAKETLESVDRSVARQLATMRQAFPENAAHRKAAQQSPRDNGEPIPQFLREPINLNGGKQLSLVGRPSRVPS